MGVLLTLKLSVDLLARLLLEQGAVKPGVDVLLDLLPFFFHFPSSRLFQAESLELLDPLVQISVLQLLVRNKQQLELFGLVPDADREVAVEGLGGPFVVYFVGLLLFQHILRSEPRIQTYPELCRLCSHFFHSCGRLP